MGYASGVSLTLRGRFLDWLRSLVRRVRRKP